KLFNKKGMTLVEVIVVLVILAILAAVLVPTMIGWIDKAKKKTSAAEARAVYLAAQTLASEKYAEVEEFSIKPGDENYTKFVKDVAKLADVKVEDITELVVSNGKVTKVVYKQVTLLEPTPTPTATS
ncbi:MAG TPA: prepilin-type N-terminal cleavage/methylation domain-containing protein, partial [Clostridiaceae bacterium]|nr:prepilin-type N-terminal cleavage/methylation domain-containing protein [Clostridiaceae bacterium]